MAFLSVCHGVDWALMGNHMVDSVLSDNSWLNSNDMGVCLSMVWVDLMDNSWHDNSVVTFMCGEMSMGILDVWMDNLMMRSSVMWLSNVQWRMVWGFHLNESDLLLDWNLDDLGLWLVVVLNRLLHDVAWLWNFDIVGLWEGGDSVCGCVCGNSVMAVMGRDLNKCCVWSFLNFDISWLNDFLNWHCHIASSLVVWGCMVWISGMMGGCLVVMRGSHLSVYCFSVMCMGRM